jgi:hypothetical protein
VDEEEEEEEEEEEGSIGKQAFDAEGAVDLRDSDQKEEEEDQKQLGSEQETEKKKSMECSIYIHYTVLFF